MFDDCTGVYRDSLADADPSLPLVINGWIGDTNGVAMRLPVGDNVHYCGVHVAQGHFHGYGYDRVIGVRDPYSEAKLKRLGLNAMLIGCATLLFRPYVGPRAGEYSVECDGPGRMLTHVIDGEMPWSNQWRRAVELLDIYKRASMVYTRKQHAALPCLAFGTPVTFLGQLDDERFSILRWLRVQPSNCIAGVDLSTVRNVFVRFVEGCLGRRLTLGEPQFPPAREWFGGMLRRQSATLA